MKIAHQNNCIVSKDIQLTITMINVHTEVGNEFLFPLLYPLCNYSVNPNSEDFISSYSNYIQANILNMENYIELMSLVTNSQIEHIQFPFTVNKSEAFDIFEDTILYFDLFYWKIYKNQFRGKVPVLGLEAIATSKEELLITLEQSIHFHWTIQNIYADLKKILGSQIISKVSFENKILNLPIRSKVEPEELYKKKEKELITSILNPVDYLQGLIFGMVEEWNELSDSIQNRDAQNVLVIGQHGSGKTKLITEFIKNISKNKENIFTFKQISASKLIRSLTEESSWQSKLIDLVTEIKENKIIVYLGVWSEYFEIGQHIGNNVSLGEAFRDYIQKNDLKVIAECTEEEFGSIEHRFPGYAQNFRIVRMRSKRPDLILEIIIKSVNHLYSQKNIEIDEKSITDIFRLHKRFFPYSGIPGKTIRFFESLLHTCEKNTHFISRDRILSLFCNESGIPRFMIDNQLPLDEKNIKFFLESRVFAQSDAIAAIVNIIFSVKAGLSPEQKPIASLFFAGPTGVGKTEMAKAITEFMFGSSEKMIRLDMSEYNSPSSVYRIMEDFSNSQSLVSKVRQHSFSVLLFDEIEKADSSFFELLLQILGEGRLTDSNGHTANFCSSIIIMTSNLGAAESMQNSIGFDSENSENTSKYSYLKVIESNFRYELINRFDQIIIFSQLDETQRIPIIEKEIKNITNRKGFLDRNIQLIITDEVKSYLSQLSINSKYGAREIKRIVHNNITIPLSEQLNHQSALLYFSEILIHLKDNTINFEVKNSELALDTSQSSPELEEMSTLRRTFEAVTNADSYLEFENKLQSQENELNEFLRKTEMQNSNYLKNHIEILKKSYQTSRDIQSTKLELESQIYKAEKDLFVDFCRDSVSQSNGNQGDLKNNFQKWLYELYSLLYGDYFCFLRVFGQTKLISNLFNFYILVLQEQKFDFEVSLDNRRISQYSNLTERKYFQDSIQNTKEPYLEFQIKGFCPYAFFANETGKVKVAMEIREFLTGFVQVVTNSKTPPPKNVNRESFYRSYKNANIFNFYSKRITIESLNKTIILNPVTYVEYLRQKWETNIIQSLLE